MPGIQDLIQLLSTSALPDTNTGPLIPSPGAVPTGGDKLKSALQLVQPVKPDTGNYAAPEQTKTVQDTLSDLINQYDASVMTPDQIEAQAGAATEARGIHPNVENAHGFLGALSNISRAVGGFARGMQGAKNPDGTPVSLASELSRYHTGADDRDAYEAARDVEEKKIEAKNAQRLDQIKGRIGLDELRHKRDREGVEDDQKDAELALRAEQIKNQQAQIQARYEAEQARRAGYKSIGSYVNEEGREVTKMANESGDIKEIVGGKVKDTSAQDTETETHDTYSGDMGSWQQGLAQLQKERTGYVDQMNADADPQRKKEWAALVADVDRRIASHIQTKPQKTGSTTTTRKSKGGGGGARQVGSVKDDGGTAMALARDVDRARKILADPSASAQAKSAAQRFLQDNLK